MDVILELLDDSGLLDFLPLIIVLLLPWVINQIISSIVSSRTRRIVLQTSTLLKILDEVNAKYSFYENATVHFTSRETLSSKAKLERFELINILDDVIYKSRGLHESLGYIAYNRDTYEEYIGEVKRLRSRMTAEEAKQLHVSLEKYWVIEQEIFQRRKLKPPLDICVECVAEYTSPQGRNQYTREYEYDYDDVQARIVELNRMLAAQNTEEMRRKNERAKMSDKLRYSILKRDGFRCMICGRTAADGVKLHVDHIIPISKGGKTEPGNLRTLCEACNLGKSDTLE